MIAHRHPYSSYQMLTSSQRGSVAPATARTDRIFSFLFQFYIVAHKGKKGKVTLMRWNSFEMVLLRWVLMVLAHTDGVVGIYVHRMTYRELYWWVYWVVLYSKQGAALHSNLRGAPVRTLLSNVLGWLFLFQHTHHTHTRDIIYKVLDTFIITTSLVPLPSAPP